VHAEGSRAVENDAIVGVVPADRRDAETFFDGIVKRRELVA
jgi:hypothetical protein